MKIATLIALVSCCLATTTHAADVYDIVLKSSRVIDPETRLDGIRDVGICGDTIAAVSTTPLEGARAIDARGLVVAPGFIDLHQHG